MTARPKERYKPMDHGLIMTLAVHIGYHLTSDMPFIMSAL